MRLSRAVRLVSGSGFPHDEQGGTSGVPFLKVSDLDSVGPHDAVATAVNYVSRSQLARMRATVVPPGTVLMPKIGAAIRGRHRRVRLGVSAAFDNNVVALVPLHVDSRYLTYWLSQLPVEPLTHPGAVASLDMAAFRALSLPNLRLMAQREVSEFLGRECARIDLLMGSLDELDASARSGVVERLRALVFGPGWPLAPVKYYARTGTGHTPSRTRDDYWIPEERVVPWFTLADVNQIRDGRRWEVSNTAERISEIGIANSSARKHPARTVVLSRTASVGFSAVMKREMAVSQDFMTWTCGPDLDPFYLLVALRAMQPELRRLMYGSTHKTIYMPDLHALQIPLPPLESQREIVAKARHDANALWRLSDELGSMIVGLREYRDALITEAVTGQLDVVKLADSEMAESLAAVCEGEPPEVLAR